MAAVTKTAYVVSLGEGPTINGPDDPNTGSPMKIVTMQMTIVLGKGTSGEQRATFMLLESDYVDLGSPSYGGAVDVTLTNEAA